MKDKKNENKKPLGKRAEGEIDPDKIADDPGLLPYAHNVGSIRVRPEDKGKIKGRAVAAMNEQTIRQMEQIKGQIYTLADQARRIKTRVEISERIYAADINFEPVSGKGYYVYEKEDGSTLLSMIAPEEWGRKKPFKKYLCTVKLMYDHTWEVTED